ncbi:MAG: hypothetical protein B7Z58_10975 [Acidiphilium sp. 37-64-53]|nr:MAG: hypothetical protein B7Z58_10975 [Acidiphilium sp. 37-64-53]
MPRADRCGGGPENRHALTGDEAVIGGIVGADAAQEWQVVAGLIIAGAKTCHESSLKGKSRVGARRRQFLKAKAAIHGHMMSPNRVEDDVSIIVKNKITGNAIEREDDLDILGELWKSGELGNFHHARLTVGQPQRSHGIFDFGSKYLHRLQS